MAVKNYMINDKWLDMAKQNIVEVKSTDGVIGSVKVNGQEYGGGGGSSDFSTAEVTIVGQATIEGALVAVGTESAEFPDETTYGTTDYALQGLNSLTLILYKGSAFITVMGKGDIEVSGNIQPFAQTSNQFIVTGDCTITIS